MDSILMNSVTFQRNDKLPQEMDSILMSSSEKQWVTKIQMLQIQTANPYEEDYYYQVLHCDRYDETCIEWKEFFVETFRTPI